MRKTRDNDSNGPSKNGTSKNRKHRENEKKIAGGKRKLKRIEIPKENENREKSKNGAQRRGQKVGSLTSILLAKAYKKFPSYTISKLQYCNKWSECVTNGRVLYGLYFMANGSMHQVFIKKREFHKQEGQNVYTN